MGPTNAIIHTDNFRHNIRVLREHVGSSVKICAAFKADAYGHGASRLCGHAIEEGVSHFAVATPSEGVLLRRNNLTIEILLLTLSIPEEFPFIIENGLQAFVADEEYIRGLNSEALKQDTVADVHLHIDTGMSRSGCRFEDSLMLAQLITDLEGLNLAGVSTHFACSDDPGNPMTENQFSRFRTAVENIRSAGIDTGLIHTSNSGAVIGFPDGWVDMIRPGVSLYGYYPGKLQKRDLPLRPVMELRTKVVMLKKIPAGSTVSYGATYTAKEDTWIATLAAGYGDGYSRLLSSRGNVLIRGKRYRIAGRVCMDQTLVDLGPETDAELYDDAVLFGEGPDADTAEDVADLCGTISYEITCNVNKRVPRIYIP